MPKPYVPNDKWSQKAAAEGYRARSVYKLMELDERLHLLAPAMTVVDLGAAPGSWLQWTSKKIGPAGRAIGFDLQEIKPVGENVATYVADISDKFGVEDVLRKEGIRQADVVLSDIAPNTSGIKDVDQWKSVELARASLAIALDVLKPGGKCVVKVFRGGDFDEFYHELKMDWQDVKLLEVAATRDRSREVYVSVRKPNVG